MPAPRLQVISPDATPEEMATIVAAVTLATRASPAGPPDGEALHDWVRTARLRAHRAALRRGPWRLSGRMPPRSRA